MRPAIEFRNVSFTYPGAGVPAITDADLQLNEGLFVLVSGPTGAGKSTLLRCINGLVPHFSGGRFSGQVLVGGRNTLESAPRYLSDVVAFVPQEPAASFVLERVEDELAYAMENLGVEPRAMRRRVEETLDLMDIASLRGRSVGSISGGERQRVAIGAALTTGPRILVLDEPTSQLDPQGAEDVLAVLQRLVHDLGVTVVVAEHRLERVAGFADLVVSCRPGIPVEVGAPDELLAAAGGGPPVARLGRLMGWRPVPLTVRAARAHASDTYLPEHRADRDPPDGAELLRTTGLNASYSDRRVLGAIDLSVRRGEVVAVLGRNGAGKTTLLRCMAGLHRSSKGIVRADGRSPRPGIDVALCLQDSDTLLFRSSVLDEVDATAVRGPLVQDTLQILTDLGISELADTHPRDLSAGQRLLVTVGAIARTGAPILLLDEPTRGLDPEAKSRLVSFLRRHTHAGGCVVIATHDVELAAEVATRAVMLAAGEIVAEGSPHEVMGDSVVFAPQTARVFGPSWLTPDEVASFVRDRGRVSSLIANQPPEGPS